MAERCLGKIYTNPRNPEDHDPYLGWIDSSHIVENITLWKYTEFLEAAAASAARGMYVAHHSGVP
jgi:hypothetical protein